MTLSAACREVFAVAPAHVTALHGGDLSEVLRVGLADGRVVVAKRGPLVGREARMLAALAAAGAPAPRVLGISGDVLFLEALEEVRPGRAHWARFGADLAGLHADAGDAYGWEEDYAFGPVTIANAPVADWPGFWAERRLLPFVPGLAPELARRVERLASRLGERLPARPKAGLLHGDLWSGNLLPTPGAIHLIDPACYRGHGEVDLAMLHLFGQPGAGFAEGYGAPDPGWQERRAVYTLFPALVHLTLFGAGYRGLVERFLRESGV
ncbi:MAG: aminoglycoside phosphotransferase [Rhodobacterales bacterium]|nr:MAG: aminoglycoside phosphotransferase [Rhodobacterales bacterium]